ncbi:MAG: DUF4176 domain-containing protein [Lactococcus sp.]|uniref:DUF4176 domain-containing protein n=1 Tax=Pseudolactococcus carnosus TaxID=2749961 RepID=UPI001FBB545E|nr:MULTISPECIES: DUF4176 domain-containing protein [Lactococcus]MBR6896136.1 DUF4176 domain-containing protein [Lactococcus sp.]MCJ2003238.1 DUF4176 domain-containing protein [Lactococcus carnosus]MDN5403809.1 DUF4176 domain-containing protein [Lactococcus sp.]MDN5410759.1 DUF4176 domain-containing protein [Lactococcus sp.]MDN5412914.1 DUF4176 domain-containing protein [Lactococcus sp.]
MTDTKQYLALGSIVILKGAIKKLMIISRANLLDGNFFTYGAILYPEGMIDENIAYFNDKDIIKVIHEGFVDEDDALLVSQLEQAYQTFDANQADMAEPVAVSDEETDPFDAFREMED